MLDKKIPLGAGTITDTEVKADPDGAVMMDLLVTAQNAIGKYFGKECEIVVAVHPKHGPDDRCAVFVITPFEKPVDESAGILHQALGGLQVLMMEQQLAMEAVKNGSTIN